MKKIVKIKSKIQNILFFLSQTGLVLAQSDSSTTSSPTTGAPVGIIVAWWICNSRKQKPIGGLLLFYYIQLYSAIILSVVLHLLTMETFAENLNIANWGNETTEYFLYLLSAIPLDLLLVVEVIVGSMLLSQKFKNRKIYNFLRITLAAQVVFGLISSLIDYNYWPENLVFDILPLIISAFWLGYFTYSKRTKMVFVENKWDPNILYPQKVTAGEKK